MEKIEFKDMQLSSEIIEALSRIQYNNPTKVQQIVIPEALINGQDLIVKAQTGSGKTAAFGIPLCEKLVLESRDPQALILSPTRELAVQIKTELGEIGKYKALRVASVFGKQPVKLEARELAQRVHIIVGTPGRVLDHLEKGRIRTSQLRYVIIDEGDKMLSMGFIDQVESILKQLVQMESLQLFSATIPDPIKVLCQKYMKNVKEIEVEHEVSQSELIEQYICPVAEEKKYDLLKSLIYSENIMNGVLFLNTREEVDRLCSRMKKDGFSVEALHGGLEQKDRLRVLEEYKQHEFDFLTATDVAARGLHIDDITHIINFEVPMEQESYVHRIGRTGRAGKKGTSFTLVAPRELKFMEAIEAYIGYKIQIMDQDRVLRGEISELQRQYHKNRILAKQSAPVKQRMSLETESDIFRIYIGAGKKNKLRAVDLVGAICNLPGIEAGMIGIIDIQDYQSYVDILAGKGKYVLQELKKSKIKGKSFKVEQAAAHSRK